MEPIRNFFTRNPVLKKGIGVLFVILGVLALVTPLTPGSWLAFVGLELLGLRFVFWEKIRRGLEKGKKEKEAESSSQKTE
jgi:hypothetical protein